MTKENAKELRMDLAKDALALLILHGELDVRSHRECIELIGEAWDIPAEERRKPLALLEKEQASLRTGKGYVRKCWSVSGPSLRRPCGSEARRNAPHSTKWHVGWRSPRTWRIGS